MRQQTKALLWSKRNWGLVALSAAEIARAVWPNKVPDLSLLIRALFGA